MSEHTPGPWAAVGKSVRTAATIGRKNDAPNGYQGGICNCLGGSFDKYEQDQIAKANARLISAAPELLEALESFVHLYEAGAHFDESTLRKVVNGMRAAIARAKGESESLATSEEKSE